MHMTNLCECCGATHRLMNKMVHLTYASQICIVGARHPSGPALDCICAFIKNEEKVRCYDYERNCKLNISQFEPFDR